MNDFNTNEITSEFLEKNGFSCVEDDIFLHKEYHIILKRYVNLIDKKTEYEWRYADEFGTSIWHLKYRHQLSTIVNLTNELTDSKIILNF